MKLVIGGKTLEPESIKSCVLYDPSDGRIVHQHEVVNFPGAKAVENEEIESKAVRLAAKLGHDISKLKALHLSGAFPSDKRYRVDTNERLQHDL